MEGNMNLQQLYYFKVVAEKEHFTRAAEELMISQPCLSYSISEIEKEIQAPLFEKEGRNVRLTKYGKVFLEHITAALNEIELGKSQVEEMLRPDSGKVTLAYMGAVNTDFVSQLVSGFIEEPENSGIKFEFRRNSGGDAKEAFRDGRCDLAFGPYQEDSALEFRKIYKDKLVAIVSHFHPFSLRNRISLREIAAEKFVAFETGSGSRKYIDELFEQGKITPNIACEVVDGVMITSIVAGNLGVSIVPQMYSAPYYNVKALEIDGADVKRNMYMIWKKKAFLSPVAERFRDYVISHVFL